MYCTNNSIDFSLAAILADDSMLDVLYQSLDRVL
jgi:hypothetical protein